LSFKGRLIWNRKRVAVALDAADDGGTGYSTLKMPFLCYRICRFFRPLQYIFFAAISEILNTILALHSIKCSDSANAAQFCSAES
jgi:hypothetical protein